MIFKDPLDPIVGCLTVVLFSMLDVFHCGTDFFMPKPVFYDVCVIIVVFMFFLDESCDGTPVSHVVWTEMCPYLFSVFA